MIIPETLEPVDNDEETVGADRSTTLRTTNTTAVAVALVIESPPVRVTFDGDEPTFGSPAEEFRDRRGLLLGAGDHFFPTTSSREIKLIADEGTAWVSAVWLAPRAP